MPGQVLDPAADGSWFYAEFVAGTDEAAVAGVGYSEEEIDSFPIPAPSRYQKFLRALSL